MNDEDLTPTGMDNAWLDAQNEEAIRSREEADFQRGDPREEGEEREADDED